MGNKIVSVMICSLLFFLIFSISFAETIILKSGKSIEGKIIEKTDKYIKIVFQDVNLTYFLDEIESIDGTSLITKDSHDSNELLANSPLTLEDLQYLASQYLALGDLDRSILYAQEALSLNKNDTHLYQNIATAYLFKKDFENAALNYKKFLEIAKIKAQELVEDKTNDSSYQFGRADTQSQDFEKEQLLLLIGPTYATLHNIYLAMGRKDKAEELINDYEKFLKLMIIKTNDSKSESLAAYNTGINKDLTGIEQMRKFVSEVDTDKVRSEIEQNIKQETFADLLQTQIKSNESNVVANLQVISSACQVYRMEKGSYPESLIDLCHKGVARNENYLDNKRLCIYPGNPKIYGYEIEYVLKDKDNFFLTAKPIIPSKTGNRYFTSDQTGKIDSK